MKPPYDITNQALQLIAAISKKLGEANVYYLDKPTPQLRKQNTIKTIHSSLQIEGNTLTEEQITALMDNKRVIGPQKDVLEVLNAIKLYKNLEDYTATSEKSFLKAHSILMDNLINTAGKYRTQSVGIAKGLKVKHIAPPHKNIPYLMKNLFNYLNHKDELTLIKSCVFHYELEFIHPFVDGNGRMGRLWQTVILMEEHPIFEFLPFETLISRSQKEYYHSLALSDKAGKSTHFIEYILRIINESLEELLNFNNRILKDIDRLEYFIKTGTKKFTRKEYRNIFKNISSATASRDLKKGIELGMLAKTGDKNKTIYKIAHQNNPLKYS